jgi:hypothetical protein
VLINARDDRYRHELSDGHFKSWGRLERTDFQGVTVALVAR